MDLTLIPVCSISEHELIYDINNYRCDICNKYLVKYKCRNCEYGRCKRCHEDIRASQDIKKRLNIQKVKNEIKLAELNLKRDGLDSLWEVQIHNSKIVYVNKKIQSVNYDYPSYESPYISPDTTPEKYNYVDDHIRCSFIGIFNTIKSYF
jgi:hypothetical protein